MSEEQALNMLLMSWSADAAPDGLRSRVQDSFRRQLRRQAGEEEEVMKRCPMCYAEFAPQFRFCPVDGLPLVSAQQSDAINGFTEAEWEELTGEFAPVGAMNESVPRGGHAKQATFAAASMRPAARGEYHLTLLTEASLFARLTTEVRAVTAESRLTWPEFKRDPRAFVQRTVVGYGLLLRRSLARENVGYGLVTALIAVLTLIGAVVALEGYHKAHPDALAKNAYEDLEVTGWVNIPPEQKQEAGPAGMAARGTGGGSAQNKERPSGGGGGGRDEALPASHGKLPPATLQPPIVAPDPKPPAITNPHLPVQATLQGDPVLFPPDPRPLPFGDPKSQATELSSGSGDGNGIGEGNGGGVGTGNGDGYGPGDGWNTGGGPAKLGGNGPGCCGGTVDYANTIFTVNKVTRRAVITAKPEPQFTEEARKNGVTGEVALRMVLSASGQVTNIVPLKRLPDGLTEKAIEAARKIQFTPAEKDGHKVSQYVSVVYNFNIY